MVIILIHPTLASNLRALWALADRTRTVPVVHVRRHVTQFIALEPVSRLQALPFSGDAA